jgi:hypothetical protein
MCDWDSHNHGLIQLIRLRGLEQFRRQDGRNLFCVVFNNLVSEIFSHVMRF